MARLCEKPAITRQRSRSHRLHLHNSSNVEYHSTVERYERPPDAADQAEQIEPASEPIAKLADK